MGRLRKVTLILPLVAASVALAACGSSTSGSTSGSSGKTLTVYVGAQPNYPQQFAQWSKDITAKFKAATGANLQIETYSSASDETTKIQTSIVSGSGPDVYVLGTTFTPVAYGTKGFLTLSAADWTAAGGKSRLLPQTLGMSGPNSSTQIGIPVAMRPFGMIYNTALFKAAGIANPPTTWDELIADAQKLTKNGVYGMAVGYADTYDPWKFIWAFTHQAGGSLVSKDLKTAQLNSPQVVNATTQYFDLL
ncbi:MAG: extracellular solute-binding protein, partial [Propionibacterium sp.]|nr:extracellular solute-binding protein [Propionibacterium sp.]